MTIGEAIEQKKQEYIRLYESLKDHPVRGCDPATLATHDLRVAKYINERALEAVEDYIKSKRTVRK